MRRRTLLSTAGLCGLAPALAWAQTTPRTRYSSTDPAARNDLEALSNAVAQMLKKTDATDPQSWMYWVNVHGITSGTSVPQDLRSIWGTCNHSNYFLAWHRLYLIYFEALIARLSGKNDFAMPYWNWYASLDIPPAFETPGNSSNPLWRQNRGYSKRYGVTTDVLAEPTYVFFNAQSFGDPHSPIHVNFRGDMSSPPTAARDPVFWPHHAAMDRLWEIWLSKNTSHQNPKPTDPWAAKSFSFLTGPSGTRSVSTVLDIASLGYKYDNLNVTTQEAVMEALPAKPTRIETGRSIAQTTESVFGPSLLSQKARTVLHGDALTVRLPLPVNAGPALESLGTPEGQSLRVRLSGVSLTSEGEKRGVLYNVYVNLPAERGRPGTARHRIGQISSFGLTREGHAHGGADSVGGSTVEFSITRLVPGLKAAGRWDPKKIDVDFIEPSGEKSAKPLITIGQVEVLTDRE